MSNSPDISGQDVNAPKTLLESLEAANNDRIERLKTLGMPEEALYLTSMGHRLEAIYNNLPASMKAAVDLTYEQALAEALTEALEDFERPKIVSPNEMGGPWHR